jgi:hypothetical protein
MDSGLIAVFVLAFFAGFVAGLVLAAMAMATDVHHGDDRPRYPDVFDDV